MGLRDEDTTVQTYAFRGVVNGEPSKGFGIAPGGGLHAQTTARLGILTSDVKVFSAPAHAA